MIGDFTMVDKQAVGHMLKWLSEKYKVPEPTLKWLPGKRDPGTHEDGMMFGTSKGCMIWVFEDGRIAKLTAAHEFAHYIVGLRSPTFDGETLEEYCEGLAEFLLEKYGEVRR